MKNNKMVAGERFVEGLFLYMDDEGDVWLADVNNELLKQPFHYSESSKNQMFSIIWFLVFDISVIDIIM